MRFGKPLLWLRAKIGRACWRLYFANSQLDPNLCLTSDGSHIIGITYTQKRSIHIDVTAWEKDQQFIVLHELAHAALDDAGLTYHEEEKVIAPMSPLLFGALRHLGLKWPNKPRGYKAFRDHAWEIAK